ncbi:hypothetical protein [Komagataeibacter xylinus]|uniref:hypothetical protein n=1 Tax=Komagataeibacter xylinus TaxID=28448 RepID=UPI00280AFA24|nr:hypothetical protein [Komagataeibacter xylinus]
MSRAATLKALLLETGGLLLFWGCDALGYEHYASMAVLAFVLADGLRRWQGALGFPRVWHLFNGLALALAALDLATRREAWASFESVAANLLIASMFVIGALGRKPLVQDIAEQRQGKPFPTDRHDLQTFFRAYTWVWAAYFAVRAFVWFWMAQHLPVARAHALQGILGPVTLFVMIALSFQGQRVFRGLNRLGLFRE